jgi:hypothetical protein
MSDLCNLVDLKLVDGPVWWSDEHTHKKAELYIIIIIVVCKVWACLARFILKY